MYRHQRDCEREDAAKSVTIDLESQSLTTLNISTLRLSGANPNVTELNLNYNSLSTLPSDFADAFPKLQILSLCGNELKELPSCIGLLKDLQSLSVNENEIAELPVSMFQLSKLAELYLLGNRLKQLHPDLRHLTSLRKLTLEDNQLVELPTTFGELHSLRVLEASENHLEFLPKNFGKLVNLSVLNLSRNKLMELPESFGDLPSLQYVDLSNNFIPELPQRLVSASTSLLKFSASNNLLKQFPPWMAELAHIQELYIGDNYIDHELPEQFGAVSGKSLKHMDLGANHLECLPQTMGQLTQVETLHFGSHILEIERRAFQNGNRITHLPESFGQMLNLRHLRLDENQLFCLPESIGDLQNLEYLDLGQNVLRELPASFTRLSSLKTCLLSKNHITRLPEDFGNLSSLHRLRLNTNQLRNLPSSFSQLTNLQFLDLVDNLLSEFPLCLNQLNKLVRVALDENNFEIDIPEANRLDAMAIYPEDGIHKFVRTTVNHSDDNTSLMTNALATAVKKGDTYWKTHVASDHQEGMSTTSLEDEESRGTSEPCSDPDGGSPLDGQSMHDGIETNAEPENWDMEVDDDNPFSYDAPLVYTHTSIRRSPVGKDILDFQFTPSEEHPPALPLPDMDFQFEDGQFDDAE